MTTNPKSAEAHITGADLFDCAVENGKWKQDENGTDFVSLELYEDEIEHLRAALTQADHGDEVCLSKSAENERQSDLLSVNEKQAEKLAEALREIKESFDLDFMLDGEIVDGPPVSFIWARERAEQALAAYEASKNGESHD